MASVEFLPAQPEVSVDIKEDMYWKNWFLQFWKSHRRNLIVAASQTVAFTADLESYFYPCDTTAGAFAVTLPPAANTMGKQIEIYHKTSANALTVVCSGADVLSPTTVTPIALAGSVIFVSDGITTWYGFATTAGGGGGSGTVTSIDADAPVVVTPDPITATGTISITDFVASGGSHARGSVVDTPAVAGLIKFLCEDATWKIPQSANNQGGFDYGKAIATNLCRLT